jgi:hypothetical protein
MTAQRQNGSTRRSIVAGLLGLPAAAASTRASIAPTSDVLRQAELQSIFDDLKAIELKVLDYRRRILAGASVEPGQLAAEFESGWEKTHDPEVGQWGEFSSYDLTIRAASLEVSR